jgi:peroxiredoxin
MDRIFVQIASYRDAECQWTIQDLFEKAAHPDRVSVGLCWQFDPHADSHCFLIETRAAQVRRVDFAAAESRGVCWARSKTQDLWRGEEYTLLTDSHMRFVPEWDTKLIHELAACPTSKPVLSSNPPGYRPPNHLSPAARPLVRGIQPFRPDGTIRGCGHWLDRNPPHPLNGAFVVCCFVFSRAEIITEVPYDPYLYFNQEEITYSARLWTHGWDIFSPSQVFSYHYYNQDGSARPLHWNEFACWKQLNEIATLRYLHLMGMEPTDDARALKDLEKYGMGGERTLSEYENYCGVSFRRREVSKKAVSCQFIRNLEKYTDSATLGLRHPDVATDIDKFIESVEQPEYGRNTYFPMFDLPMHANSRVRLDYYGGKCLAVCLLPPASDPKFAAMLNGVREHQGAIVEARLDILFVRAETSETNETMRARFQITQRVASDVGRTLRESLGIVEPMQAPLVTYLLDPSLRILRVYCPGDVQPHIVELLRDAKPFARDPQPTIINAQAPVVIVRDVLPADLCEKLRVLYDSNPSIEGALGLGDALHVNVKHKARREYIISQLRDRDMLGHIDATLDCTLLPELCKLYRTKLTHRERYKICCYDAADDGHYDDHRDGSDPRQHYRRLSMSISLNADYEGGYLRFPEYGAYDYRVAPGSAVVFPSVLLHRVTAVTRGRRYVLISFLFNDADAELKRTLENEAHSRQSS